METARNGTASKAVRILLAAALALGALAPDGSLHHRFDEAVAAVGDEGLPVAQGVSPLILPADGLQLVPLPLRQAQGFLHQGVPLDELDRRPVGGDMGGVGLVVDQLAHLVMDLVGKAVVQIIRFNGDAHVHLPVGRLQQSLNVLP